MRREPKSVLENVARLERENAELRVRIERARASEALEETVRTRTHGRASTTKAKAKGNAVRMAAAISFGLAFGLVTLAVTLLMLPPIPGGHHPHETRGGSAGVCR